MQAEVALHLLARKPEQGEVALTAISRAATEALDELREALAAVRTPGLDRLDDLLARMAAAGVDVRLHTTGPARELPAEVDRAGYRVVQESLTNVLRHGDAKTATVRIDYADDGVLRSEEHTSELQSQSNLVCRLLLEKKKRTH